MKRAIIIMIGLFAILLAVKPQTSPTEVAPNGYITKPAYKYIGGTTSDTLKNTDTLTYVIRVKGNETQDFWSKIYLDHVSGTAGGKLKTYKSIDGVNYEVTALADSITVASVTTDILDTESITFDNFNAPYLKYIYIQSGTAVTVPRIYIYTKTN